jgi:ABC-type transport system involved in cytochrome c biogenesis ATPase subunit
MGGITKLLTSKASANKRRLSQVHALVTVPANRWLLDENIIRITNEKAKQLTQLPLADISEAYI